MREKLSVSLKLNNIICRDEGDGWGNAEPYLWTVFFKIDGETVSLTEALTLSGESTIHTTPGSHGNLDDDSVDEGDTVAIPSDIGEWTTTLEPIPVPDSLSSLVDPLGGIIGVVCILMEEDNVSDDGAEAGHQALNTAVENAINQIISTRTFANQSVSEEELEDFEDDIKSAISSAIENQQNFFENIWSWLNKDDTIGTKVFFFEHDTLADNNNINFNERWKNEGDWEITGNITTSPVCTLELSRSLSAGTSTPIDLKAIRKFRNEEFRKNPNIVEWGNILLRNNRFLVHAILRDKNLKNCAVNLTRNTSHLINNKNEKVSDEILKDAIPLIEALEKNGNKRSKLDAKRLREVIPNVKNRDLNNIVKYLSKNLPGVKPK